MKEKLTKAKVMAVKEREEADDAKAIAADEINYLLESSNGR